MIMICQDHDNDWDFLLRVNIIVIIIISDLTTDLWQD